MYFNFSKDNFSMATTHNNKKKTDEYIFSSTLDDLQLNKNLVASVNQVHSNKINFVTSPGFYKSYDGLITEIKYKLVLVIKTADCIPIFIYDNVKGIYGLIHAGWRGVQQKIHLKAFEEFVKLNSKVNDIQFFLGPSIKGCCFEVKEDLIKLFDNKFITEQNNKFFLDLNKYVISDLKEVGINKIKIDRTCSYDSMQCHSYRRDSLLSGRMYSLITYSSCNI